jgi:hypothetical protein
MKRHYKTKEKRQLKPGETHNFLVLSKITIPNDAEYFVLLDEFGEKHLLPATYYKNYPIKVKEYYLCHVDKINCQGRIFLEPAHPFYQLNKVYEFEINGTETIYSHRGFESKYYKMAGNNGEFAYLPVELIKGEIQKGILKCRISKIKKAKIILELI